MFVMQFAHIFNIFCNAIGWIINLTLKLLMCNQTSINILLGQTQLNSLGNRLSFLVSKNQGLHHPKKEKMNLYILTLHY